MGVSGVADHQAWWEFFPFNYMTPVSFSATPGDEFTTSVRYLGYGDYYEFYYYNWHTDKSDSFQVEVSDVDPNFYPQTYPAQSAEVVIERVTYNNSLTNLLNFQHLYVESAEANGVGFDSYPSSWTNGEIRHQVNMYNGTDQLTTASLLGSDGSFTITHDSCS